MPHSHFKPDVARAREYLQQCLAADQESGMQFCAADKSGAAVLVGVSILDWDKR